MMTCVSFPTQTVKMFGY